MFAGNEKIPCMRTLGEKYRLQALSIAEVREPLDELLLMYARRHKFQERSLKLGPLINGILYRFLMLPEAERERFAVEGLKALEAVLSGDAADAGDDAAEGANVVEKLIGPEASVEQERADSQRPPGAKPKAPRKGRG